MCSMTSLLENSERRLMRLLWNGSKTLESVVYLFFRVLHEVEEI